MVIEIVGTLFKAAPGISERHLLKVKDEMEIVDELAWPHLRLRCHLPELWRQPRRPLEVDNSPGYPADLPKSAEKDTLSRSIMIAFPNAHFRQKLAGCKTRPVKLCCLNDSIYGGTADELPGAKLKPSRLDLGA